VNRFFARDILRVPVVRARFPAFIAVVQSLLFAGHLLVYATLVSFWRPLDANSLLTLRVAAFLVSISFVSASLLAYRNGSLVARIFYIFAAVWLGVLTYLVLASLLIWLTAAVCAVTGVPLARDELLAVLWGVALLVSSFGILNAAAVRVRRVSIGLANLPPQWRGRSAVLVSDLHLGHVRNVVFARRIIKRVAALRPDLVLLPGDVFDGTAADLQSLAQPWSTLSVPHGIYYVTGNHEEFSDRSKYVDALRRAGVIVLQGEKRDVDGLQIVGVHYREAFHAQQLQSILQQLQLDRSAASILLMHDPQHLAAAQSAGITLQVSGHTHRGQYFPFTLIVKRIYHQFSFGLHKFGDMLVYTSCGAGTWGPPLRVGTTPEIVLIHFD
jgi:predicted MPP superfamily phosphohydrolase